MKSTSALDYRASHEERIKQLIENINKIDESVCRLPPLEDSNFVHLRNQVQDKIDELKTALTHRLNRVKSRSCRVAVIGKEKQGKSSFVNAWIGDNALPAASERCTWAASTIANSDGYGAVITFLTNEKFDEMIKSLCSECGFNWTKSFLPWNSEFENSEQAKLVCEKPAFKTLLDINRYYQQIKKYIGNQQITLSESNMSDLNSKLYQYISLVDKDGTVQPQSYAVERARINMPLRDNISFEIDDLPGINAPGNRAERMTWNAVENDADIIVLVKNAAANSSLDRDEENVWDKALHSDSAIKLTERFFVVLNKADIYNVHHNRDCHIIAKQKFIERSIPEKHVFFCSSSAEIYDRFSGIGLDFEFSEDDDINAKNRVANYYGSSEPTTGFNEFKTAIYDFIEHDLEVLENRALKDLIFKSKEIKDDLMTLIKIYDDDTNYEKDMTPEEIRRFDELWRPQDAINRDKSGLRDKIVKAINRQAKETITDSKIRERFFDSVKSTISEFQSCFIQEHITVEKFKEEGFTSISTSLDNVEKLKRNFLERIQEILKDEIYGKLGRKTAQNLYTELESRWDEIIRVSTDTANHGIGVVPIEDIKSVLNKKSVKSDSLVFSEFISSYTSSNNENCLNYAASGFEALLKSIANAPLEFFFHDDREDDIERLLMKAMLFRDGVSNQAITKKLENYFSKDDNCSINGIRNFLDNNIETVSDILSLFLPRPIGTLVKSVGKTATNVIKSDKLIEKRGRDFVHSIFNEHPVQQEKEESVDIDSEIVLHACSRVNSFFDVLSAMLFDEDFGFSGYYQSQFEEFRLAMLHEVDDGCIKDIARAYRDIIWPNEELFHLSNSRKERMALVSNLKNLLNN